VEGEVHGVFGGIRSLLAELKVHGEAITHDLMRCGWLRGDIGVRFGWREFFHFLRWMPPDGSSAYYRSRKPNSWWVSPDSQLLAAILYAAEGANWQRGGCQGNAPKPVKFPEDKEVKIADAEELAARKRRMRRSRG